MGTNPRYLLTLFSRPGAHSMPPETLLDTSETPLNTSENPITTGNIIVLIFLIFTFIFYSLTAIVHILLWDSQTLPGRTLVSVVLSRALSILIYFVSFNGLLYGWDINLPRWWCISIGVVAYYFMNSCYSWTVLLNFDLWWSFRSLRASKETKFNVRRKFIYYSCIGWGVPFVISTVTVVIDIVYKSNVNANPSLVPRYGVDCFIAESAQYFYFLYVQLFFLVPGLIFGVLTFYSLHTVRNDTSSIRRANHGARRTSLSSSSLNFKLFVIMGMSWVINVVLAWVVIPNIDGFGKNVSTVLELLVLLLDSLVTAVLTFWIYVCKRSILIKLEQKYSFFRAVGVCLREAKGKIYSKDVSIEAETNTKSTFYSIRRTQSRTSDL
ncbi:unnamed protein product [Orchesella dallaii]|uniref:G-protein coupled receptors family 2 profile 2 domain-containing protein n=1 Tax=Orchesella dallaii TaxID=48710 RepID=A0ABP1QN29_9HEXA